MGSMFDAIVRRSSTTTNNSSRKGQFSASSTSLTTQKAKESYEAMIENEKLGEVCIAEKCFVFIGTNPQEQSLMLCALKQLVDLDRMVSLDFL